MKKILIVLSSVRPNRIADKILHTVQEKLKQYPDTEVTVADFRSLPLPFFDGRLSPSNPDFAAEDANVKAWTKFVADADAVLILAAEYNYSYTAVLKNAIDWVPSSVWEDKPVGFVGYGWAGGARATTNLRNLLTGFIKADPLDTETNLGFNKEIDLEGNILDPEAVHESVTGTLDALLKGTRVAT